MLCIQDLPEEILLSICRHLPSEVRIADPEIQEWDDGKWGDQSRSLAVLARVNAHFYRLASALLYERISISRVCYRLDDCHSAPKLKVPNRRLGLLLRNLVERPDIANRVHDFRLTECSRFDDPPNLADEETPYPLSDLDVNGRENFQQMLDGAAGENCDGVSVPIVEPRSHRLMFHFALILAHLPSLRILGIRRKMPLRFWIYLDGFVSRLARIAAAAGLGRPFKDLQTVIIANSPHDPWPCPTVPIAIAAKWPSVRNLVASRYGDVAVTDYMIWCFKSLGDRSTNLREIQLGPMAELDPNCFGLLMKAPRQLQTFRYHIGHVWKFKGVPYDQVMQSLSHQRSSLRNITMYENDWSQNHSEKWSAMDFNQFQQLQSLDISYTLLFGQNEFRPITETSAQMHVLQALPKSLRSLCVAHVGCRDHIRNAVCITAGCFETILENARTSFPALTELAFAAKKAGGCYKICEEVLLPLQGRTGEGNVRVMVLEYLRNSGIVVRYRE